jgi:hypothetical protein
MYKAGIHLPSGQGQEVPWNLWTSWLNTEQSLELFVDNSRVENTPNKQIEQAI